MSRTQPDFDLPAAPKYYLHCALLATPRLSGRNNMKTCQAGRDEAVQAETFRMRIRVYDIQP